MADQADFDLLAAHKHFSAWCFNRAWDLIEKPDRTEAEARLMTALSHASIFHWISRPDCTDQNLSVGYWQASQFRRLSGMLSKRVSMRGHALATVRISNRFTLATPMRLWRERLP